ncbi:MAG: beta-ketoacyl-ACP synthase III [Anaerovoracaceae bacterium]
MVGKICGVGSTTPSNEVTNFQLEKRLDTTDQWIRERTGISTRFIIEDETTSSMAVTAAQRAIKAGNISPEEIDMIILSTVTPDMVVPSVSCIVQKHIGAVNAFCLDINAACVGFLMAMNMAQDAIKAGRVKMALVIGVESLSTLADKDDRSTAPLFGDGAGAVCLKADNSIKMEAVIHSDGTKGDYLTCETRRQKNWQQREEIKATYLSMGGQDVFRFATTEVPKSIKEVLLKANIEIDQVDYFVLHQANKRIIEAISRRLKVDISKFPMNINKYGNTSSASIPLLLDDMYKEGLLKEGTRLVISGFGGGLTWGASYLEI